MSKTQTKPRKKKAKVIGSPGDGTTTNVPLHGPPRKVRRKKR